MAAVVDALLLGMRRLIGHNLLQVFLFLIVPTLSEHSKMKVVCSLALSLCVISCRKTTHDAQSSTSALPTKLVSAMSPNPRTKTSAELAQISSNLAKSLMLSASKTGQKIVQGTLHSTLAKAIIDADGLPREQIVQVLRNLIESPDACSGASCQRVFGDLLGEKGESIEEFLDALYVKVAKSKALDNDSSPEKLSMLMESLKYSRLEVGQLNGTLTLPPGYRFIKSPVMSAPDAQGSKGAIFYVKSDSGEDWVLKVLKCAATGSCDDAAIVHLQEEAILSVDNIGIHGLDMMSKGLPPYSMLKRKVNGVSFEALIANDNYKPGYIYNATSGGRPLQISQQDFEDGLVKMIDDLSSDGRTIADLNPGNIFYDYDKRTWVVIDGDVIKEKRPQALAYVENVASLTGLWGLCDIKKGTFFEKCFFGHPRKGYPIRSAETKKAMNTTFHKLACHPKQYFKYVKPQQVRSPKIMATAVGVCGY
jgi:hypothetical protein